MKNLVLTLILVCCCSTAYASVLGIFESSNFPAELSTERDGVHRLEVIGNELYASTEKGIYKYSEASNSWTCWALENVNVIDFKVNGDDVVAIIVPEGQINFRAVEVARLVRFNLSSQETEDIMDSGMGYDYNGSHLTYIMRMAQHPVKSSVIMVAAYPGIWISEDFGTTWSFKFDWLFGYNENQFLGWHPTENDVMFYTSESAFFAAQILRSSNSGENWDIINPDKTGDNSCHHLAFDPLNSDHILYSGEGCIFESDDCGVSWHCVYRQDWQNPETTIGYAYNIMFDPVKSNTVYAVGCNSIEQCIYIFKSSDNGKTWERISKSDLFSDREYWVHEAVFFNNKIYNYTHNGVLAFNPDNNSDISDIITDIDNLNDPESVYDLYGRKVENPVSGNIYICNGKKFIPK